MIHVETKNEKVNTKIGGTINGEDLICEAVAAIVSVVESLGKMASKKGYDNDFAIKNAFIDIFGTSSEMIKKKLGVDVSDFDDDDDDEEESTFVKNVPIDSEEGRKLMELLGINEPEDDVDDDETEDDIPNFLF